SLELACGAQRDGNPEHLLEELLRRATARLDHAGHGGDEGDQSWTESGARLTRKFGPGDRPALARLPVDLVLGDRVGLVLKLPDLMADRRRIRRRTRFWQHPLTALAGTGIVADAFVTLRDRQEFPVGARGARLPPSASARWRRGRPRRGVERISRRRERGVLRVEAQSLLERLDPPFEACVRALEAEDNPLEFGAALAARFLAPATSLHAGRIGTRSRPALQEFPKTSTASTRPRHPARPAPAWRSSSPSAGPLNGYAQGRGEAPRGA